MTELYNFAATGYQPATQNYMNRYFDSVAGTWDGKPRIAYLSIDFLRAVKPLTATTALEMWMTDYIDKVKTMTVMNAGKVKREHYVLDYCGGRAKYAYYLLAKLNPIKSDNHNNVNFNDVVDIKAMRHEGMFFNSDVRESIRHTNMDSQSIFRELQNDLDNMPVALMQALQRNDDSEQVDRLHFLRVPLKLLYASESKSAIINNFNKITPAVRDQIWAEALYMYEEEKKDIYYIDSQGNLITDFSDPSILYD